MKFLSCLYDFLQILHVQTSWHPWTSSTCCFKYLGLLNPLSQLAHVKSISWPLTCLLISLFSMFGKYILHSGQVFSQKCSSIKVLLLISQILHWLWRMWWFRIWSLTSLLHWAQILFNPDNFKVSCRFPFLLGGLLTVGIWHLQY